MYRKILGLNLAPSSSASTHRWHSPACRIKSSLFLALMVSSCSVELKTSRRRWHCRVLCRWRGKKHNFSVCLSKLVFIHWYRHKCKEYIHSQTSFISSSNCKNILILTKTTFLKIRFLFSLLEVNRKVHPKEKQSHDHSDLHIIKACLYSPFAAFTFTSVGKATDIFQFFEPSH